MDVAALNIFLWRHHNGHPLPWSPKKSKLRFQKKTIPGCFPKISPPFPKKTRWNPQIPHFSYVDLGFVHPQSVHFGGLREHGMNSDPFLVTGTLYSHCFLNIFPLYSQYIWLVVLEHLDYFSKYWEFHLIPNWPTHIFKSRAQPPTSYLLVKHTKTGGNPWFSLLSYLSGGYFMTIFWVFSPKHASFQQINMVNVNIIPMSYDIIHMFHWILEDMKL